MLKRYFKSGDYMVWLTAGAVSMALVAVVGLFFLVAMRGVGHFWPAQVVTVDLIDGSNGQQLIGQVVNETGERRFYKDDGSVDITPQFQLKQGNRDVFGSDFVWIDKPAVALPEGEAAFTFDGLTIEPDMVVVERYEWGNLYGRLIGLKTVQGEVVKTTDLWASYAELVEQAIAFHDDIYQLEKVAIGRINYQIEQLRRERKKMALDGDISAQQEIGLQQRRETLEDEYKVLKAELDGIYAQSTALGMAQFELANGQLFDLSISQVVRTWQPNKMSVFEKMGFYFSSIGHFLFDDPRESNTEGGVFPAIFGTIAMVFLMTIIVTPMGVVAAIYLREYAKAGPVVRMIRISVNNLAGVPSIVFGIFGLGFFVYFLGGSIDQLFYPEILPDPTFGTPGLLWASLTLALLTLPVVIVSTEEGLARIPVALREGSLALGATKFETIRKVILPMTSPAIMTGLILAIARAAGEVAPLMLVGVVKLAPSLPIDGNAPYIHLDQKFMHLGFHIYDVGFQSPNVEASLPLVYASALLLVLVIVALNITAIWIRNRLRERYKSLDH